MKTPKFAIALLLASTSFVARAEISATTTELKEMLAAPPEYKGSFGDTIDDGAGTFCRKLRQYNVNWSATLGDSDVSFDQDMNADVTLEFLNPSLAAKGLRKGGIACTWMGGRATVNFKRVIVKARLLLNTPSGNPEVDLKDLILRGITLTNVKVIVGPYEKGGDAPQWLNDWLDNNMDKVVKKLLASELRTRLNKWINKKIAEKIRDGAGPLSVEDLAKLN